MMNETHDKNDIAEIQARHAKAYQQALSLSQSPHDASELAKFYTMEIEPLIKAISKVSGEVKTVEERAWVNKATSEWQEIAIELKRPLDIVIGQPIQPLVPPPLRKARISETEIIRELAHRAYEISRDRAAQREKHIRELLGNQQFIEEVAKDPNRVLYTLASWDTPRQAERDWSLAEIEFAADIIEGNIRFVTKIAPDSYRYLQHEWLEDVKRLKAYLFWEQSGDGWSVDLGEAHYYNACRWFHERLGDMTLKAGTSDFEDAQKFIENGLLSNGIFNARNNKDAHTLVERKARRLWEDEPERESDKNWIEAELYAREVYENIIAAVVKHDRQSTARVLNAIEPGHKNRRWYKIVDCFEAALAVYFVEKGAVDVFFAQWGRVAGRAWRL
jgi:hypothetical protein